MDGIGRNDIRVRMANAQSLFGMSGDVAPFGDARPTGIRSYDRFPARAVVAERLARQPGGFPQRMLTLVQSSIDRDPGRALDSQGNLDLGNVSALLEMF